VIEIRVCRPGELGEALAPISHYFGRTPDEERVARFERILPAERMHVASEDGRVVGATGAFAFDLTVPGGRLPTAGVAAVGVLPTHRRRGVLTDLTRVQLDAVHEREEPLAYLWASEDVIYGRFGYGIASFSGEISMSRDRAAFYPFERRGGFRLVDHDEALETFPAVYDPVAAESPGMIARTRDWWEQRILWDVEYRRRGGGEQTRVVYEVNGKPEGYAIYHMHFGTMGGAAAGFVRAVEAVGTTMEATREVWRYLFDVDWTEELHAHPLSLDHPLFFVVKEPRRLGFRVLDGPWLRLVDVGVALSSRSYASDGTVVLEVADEFCPWNAGRWKVEDGLATRTDEEPDLRCDVTALASVYLGGFTFARLARAGRIEEPRAGGVARGDALFRTDREPWCPEIF
jgi:predicted acetyltransferase